MFARAVGRIWHWLVCGTVVPGEDDETNRRLANWQRKVMWRLDRAETKLGLLDRSRPIEGGAGRIVTGTMPTCGNTGNDGKKNCPACGRRLPMTGAERQRRYRERKKNDARD